MAAKMPETPEELEQFILMVLDKIAAEQKAKNPDEQQGHKDPP